MLDGLIKWLKQYRHSGFTNAITDAKEIAEELGIDCIFKSTHSRMKKRHFGETPDEVLTEGSVTQCL